MMTLTHIYHSCFLLETDTALVVFDYWCDPDGKLHRRLHGDPRQLYFVVSHFHEDHYNAEILGYKGARLLLSTDTLRRRHVDRALPVVRLLPGEVYEDEHLQLQAFRSTDIGVSVGITLPDGTTLFHAGDLNNWYFADHDPSPLKVPLREMEGLYLSVLREVSQRYERINHLMFPIDPRLGHEMLRGITQWLRQIATDRLYPMHTWGQEIAPQMATLRELFPELTVEQ